MKPTDEIADKIGQCLFRLEMNIPALENACLDRDDLKRPSIQQDVARDIEMLKQLKSELMNLP